MITRTELVNIIFDVGYIYEQSYDTLIMAVQLADHLNEYSLLTAHTCLVLASKINEDDMYTAEMAKNDADLDIIAKEWEVCQKLDFNLRRVNFITFLGLIVDQQMILPEIFWDISRDICLNKEVMNMNPWTILTGILLLYKHGKLKGVNNYQKRQFNLIMTDLAECYGVNKDNLIKAYIKF